MVMVSNNSLLWQGVLQTSSWAAACSGVYRVCNCSSGHSATYASGKHSIVW